MEEILNLCHSSVTGHIGVTKSKIGFSVRILAKLFLPNCYKDKEDYIMLCYSCQKVGTNRDKKKSSDEITTHNIRTF